MVLFSNYPEITDKVKNDHEKNRFDNHKNNVIISHGYKIPE